MIRISWRSWLVLGVTAGCLIVLASRWKSPTPDPKSDPPFVATDSVDHGYVGWSACAECHANRVNEFQETRHFLALRLPDNHQFPRGFRDGADVFQPPGSPVRFELTADGGPRLTATHLMTTPEVSTVSPIAFVYGAGAGTDEVYFTRRGDELFELPIAWLHHQNCLGAVSFDPHGSGDLSRPLAPQCLQCHVVWVDFERGSLNRYGPFETQLLGVTCERCHGPAKTHVEHHHTHPLEKTAAHILNPKHLSRERLMDLCAQCHTNTVRYRQPPFSFRPGHALEDYFRVLEMRHPEEDRVANQVRYLKESRCYQQSEKLTCITCHDPHRKSSTDDPVASSRSCVTCHPAEDCGERSRLPEAVQGHCVACHMPKRNKVQVNFETADGEIAFPAPRYEHRIAVYPEAGKEVVFDWLGRQDGEENSSRRSEIAGELTAHWGQVAESARKEQRFLIAIDAYRTALRFGQTEELSGGLTDVLDRHKRSNEIWFEGEHLKRERRLDEAIAKFEVLLTIQPNLAKAHLELGTLYAAIGRNPEARKHLQTSIENDPNDTGAHAMLGWLAYLAGQPAAALEYYRLAAEIDPWSARIHQMVGQCLAQLGRWDDAAQALERVLTIDPKHREACRTLRQILRERFTTEDALPRALQLVELTHGRRGELLLALAEIYRDLGQISDAERTISAAKCAAERDEPDLLPQIRALESRLRSRGFGKK
ncbi:MAG: tetratricopeptide repeat protein [Planctomycetaceae bacterium]|nr:tetratricopeptide repeat protein [Planctomycetaceae bacterium]